VGPLLLMVRSAAAASVSEAAGRDDARYRPTTLFRGEGGTTCIFAEGFKDERATVPSPRSSAIAGVEAIEAVSGVGVAEARAFL